MKEEKLLDALGKIEDEMVLEAAPKTSAQGKKKSPTWIKWAAMAACVCLLVGVGALYWKAHIKGTSMSMVEDSTNEFTQLGKDDTTQLAQSEELNQDTSIPLQEFTIDQNTTVSGDELVLLDDIMQNGELGYPDWGLTLSVKDVTPSGLTLVCTQSGGEPSGELMTGEDYYLIVWRAEHWRMVVPVIENYAWNSLAYFVPLDSDTEFEIDWEWLYGELEPGTYRLVKEFMDFRKTADYDEAIYWAEFVIE